MARRVCVCAAVLLVTVCQATNIVKGLYCQDPDTKNLYPVNSTWPSQTFCGNYTCKMRKKNTTATEYAPMHKIDITNFHIKDTENTKSDMEISPSENSISIIRKTDNEKLPIFHKTFLKSNVKESKLLDKDLTGSDGYLTESEIKSITDILHTIKKSDLEAIVDIYNLAQDIYKEIDTAETANIGMAPKESGKLDIVDKPKDEKRSYWYEPIQYNKHTDMSNEETNVIQQATTKPSLDSNPTFLNGPLAVKYFGKLPYYYPMSNFQRLSSYTSKTRLNDLEKSPSEAKPCIKPTKNNNNNHVAIPWYIPNKKPESFTTAPTSTLLPYPFSYIYHSNVSGYQPYYYSYPWTHPEYNKHRNYLQPYYGAYIAQIPSYSAYNKAIVPEKQKSSESNISEEQLLDTLKSSLEKKSLPDWQTGPLSENVLDEVRAYIEGPKLKPKLLKKNIKLERVGKVLKLDEFTRQKREEKNEVTKEHANETNGDELEVYIEKIECENSTEPGFFSFGNMSQPYPSCCPKKLDSIHSRRSVIKIN